MHRMEWSLFQVAGLTTLEGPTMRLARDPNTRTCHENLKTDNLLNLQTLDHELLNARGINMLRVGVLGMVVEHCLQSF